jgi:hypothetical protein
MEGPARRRQPERRRRALAAPPCLRNPDPVRHAALALLLFGCAVETVPIQEPLPVVDAGATVDDPPPLVPPPPAPLSLVRVVPPLGPFVGGTTVRLRGAGLRRVRAVRFGGREATNLTAVDDNRLDVVLPPGRGVVEVEAVADDGAARLAGAFTYQPIAVSPAEGSVAGGTLVRVEVAEPLRQPRVFFGDRRCEGVEVVTPTRLTCRTPPGSPGAVTVSVSREGGADAVALAAYAYVDFTDRGGLSGGPFDGTLDVTVLDRFSSGPVAGALVVLDGVGRARANPAGQLAFSGTGIPAPLTLHVAAPCYERTSIVGFDAARATVLLVPYPTEGCPSDPPGGGPPPFAESTLEGRLLFPGGPDAEPWSNVPAPPTDARRRAIYVFRATPRLDRRPSVWSPAWGPYVEGQPLEYALDGPPGGEAVFALAGLEEPDDPATFVPYAMGVTRDVITFAGATTTGVDITLDLPLDHTLGVEVPAPERVDGAPDRVEVRAYVDLGAEGLLVPGTLRTNVVEGRASPSRYGLPGQPAFRGPLADAVWRAEAVWRTGPRRTVPWSGARAFGAPAFDDRVVLPAFLGVPALLRPRSRAELLAAPTFRWRFEGPAPDFFELRIREQGGDVAWSALLAGDLRALSLPDLSEVDGLRFGRGAAITGTLVAVNAGDFDAFRYEALRSAGWRRWASQSFLFPAE